MTPEEEQIIKIRAHLIAEAFPDHFALVILVKRMENGELEKGFGFFAQPRGTEERRAMYYFLSKINPEAFPSA